MIERMEEVTSQTNNTAIHGTSEVYVPNGKPRGDALTKLHAKIPKR